MIFVTFNPYNDTDILIKEEIETCFICYEVLDGINTPIRLNNNIYYLKKCKCDGAIHINCLEKWFKEHFSCPVCRGLLVKKINGSNEITNIYLFFTSFSPCLTFYNTIIKIKKTLLFIIFIYFILEFYYTILHNKYSNNYSNNYSNKNTYSINYEIYSEMYDFDTVYNLTTTSY